MHALAILSWTFYAEFIVFIILKTLFIFSYNLITFSLLFLNSSNQVSNFSDKTKYKSDHLFIIGMGGFILIIYLPPLLFMRSPGYFLRWSDLMSRRPFFSSCCIFFDVFAFSRSLETLFGVKETAIEPNFRSDGFVADTDSAERRFPKASLRSLLVDGRICGQRDAGEKIAMAK